MTETLEIEGFGSISLTPDSMCGKPRVLLVDDQPTFTEAAKGDLRSRGVEVDVAANLASASELIQRFLYHAIVMDDNLGLGSIPGSEWLRYNLAGLAGAKVAMLTANPVPEVDRRYLATAGVRFARKAGAEQEKLYSELADLGPDVAASDKRRIREFVVQLAHRSKDADDSSTPALSDAIRNLFIEWLCSLPHQDERIIWMGTKNLSIRELVEIGRSGGSIGNEHLEMFVSHLRKLLGHKG